MPVSYLDYDDPLPPGCVGKPEEIPGLYAERPSGEKPRVVSGDLLRAGALAAKSSPSPATQATASTVGTAADNKGLPSFSTLAFIAHKGKSVADRFKASYFEEPVDLPDDVYTIFFLSEIGGPGFRLAAFVYMLKMSLYTFLVLEAANVLRNRDTVSNQRMVLAAQFLMIPVAVAIQEDLISTFHMVSNLKYTKAVEKTYPHASKWKYFASNFYRAFDGFFLLTVNFIVLLTATDVLTVFLNFAALMFLQELDDLAFGLAADGYFDETLESLAQDAKDVQLPRNHNKFLRSLDSIFFLSTVVILIILWVIVQFVIPRTEGM